MQHKNSINACSQLIYGKTYIIFEKYKYIEL